MNQMNFTRNSHSYQEYMGDIHEPVDFSAVDTTDLFDREDNEEDLFDSNSQIANSLAHLDALKSDVIRNITSIQVSSNSREDDRRLLEGTRRDQRQRVVQRLKDESAVHFETIENSWASVFSNAESKSPLHLQKQLQNLELQYHDLLSLKNECMNFLRRQMSEKDEEYVSMLKKQESNIEYARLLSIDSMKEMKSAYRTELANIEESFASDRSKRILENSAQVDQLELKQQTAETRHVVALKQLYKQNREAIDQAYDAGVEECKTLEDNLGANIMGLQCKVATSRRSYEAQVNYMEYEHRVKTRENKGNQEMLQRQKKWVKKYMDELIHTREKFFITLESNATKMKQLEQKSRSAERRTNAVEVQLKHFADADGQRYKAILEMHLEDIETIMARIQQAETLIYERILGIRSPSQSKEFMEMKKSTVKVLTGIVSKENLWYQCLEDEPKTLDTILFQNLDRILSEYKSNVDEKLETMRSIQRLQKETQQLEEQVQKTLQSDLTKSLLYPPRISTT